MEVALPRTSYASQAAPVLLPTVFVLAIVYISTQIFSPKSVKLPRLGNKGSDYITDCPRLLREGYRKWSAWQMETVKGTTVLLARQYMVELLKRSEETPREFELPVIFDFQPKYTGMTTFNPKQTHIVRDSLTSGIPRIFPRLYAEINKNLGNLLPHSKEWSEVAINPIMQKLIALSSGNIFVGPDLCDSPAWVEGSVKTAMAAFRAGARLKTYSWWLRPFVYKSLPELQGLKKIQQDIRDLINPEVEKRREMAKQPGWEQKKPDDYLQWYLDSDHEWDEEEMPSVMAGLGMLSVSSTSNTGTQAIYDLAARPEYVEPLRKEVEEVMAQYNGKMSKEALNKLVLMDSFLKESQRMNPEIYAVGKRILLTDFILSDGTFLPKGTYVCCPTEAVTHDPAHYEDPDKFDGFRHWRLRQKGGYAGEKHQWICSTTSALNFGYGKHSCPGRFFAAVEIKAVFVHLLMHYDIALPKGKEDLIKRVVFGDHGQPNPQGRILLRERT